MTSNYKYLAILGALVAIIVALLSVSHIEAQKTIKNSFQQSVSSGSNSQSVYGGYEQSPVNARRQQAPFKQQRGLQQQQSFVSRHRTESARQTAFQQPQQPQQQQQQQREQAASSSDNSQQAEADAEPASYGSVQGQSGQDFPAYTRVPKTSFSCEGLPYDYGMYADEETGCQAYHVCYSGRKDSFLCGPGTVFNQRILHCDYWYSVDCGKSSQYYSSNAFMGSSQPEPGPAEAGTSQVSQQRLAAPNSNGQASSSSLSTSIYRPASPSKVQRNKQSSSASSFSGSTQQAEESY